MRWIAPGGAVYHPLRGDSRQPPGTLRALTNRLLAPALAALVLAACATPQPPSPSPAPGPAPAPVPAPPSPQPRSDFSALQGWDEEDHAAALAAYAATCHAARDPRSAEVCRRALAAGPLSPQAARSFLEANFRLEPVTGEGVLTGYFAPEYEARETPSAEFSAPVRPRPADLVAGRPYLTRAEIEAAPPGEVLAWMRPEEHFFLQIQGSGVLTYADGRRVKALYAATNGQPFVGVANPMRERGLLAADNTSGEAIRAWLAAHRGPEADAIMRLNPRFAFFRLEPDDGKHPLGAAGIPLPPGRAVAIDPAHHGFGELFWIDAAAPILTGAFPTYRRLVTSLDTGGAIKGEVRADLYLGLGAAAGAEAGRIRHTLRMHRLAPRVGPAP